MAFENIVYDRTIDALWSIEGLWAYAVDHNDETEIRRLKALLDKLVGRDV